MLHKYRRPFSEFGIAANSYSMDSDVCPIASSHVDSLPEVSDPVSYGLEHAQSSAEGPTPADAVERENELFYQLGRELYLTPDVGEGLTREDLLMDALLYIRLQKAYTYMNGNSNANYARRLQAQWHARQELAMGKMIQRIKTSKAVGDPARVLTAMCRERAPAAIASPDECCPYTTQSIQ